MPSRKGYISFSNKIYPFQVTLGHCQHLEHVLYYDGCSLILSPLLLSIQSNSFSIFPFCLFVLTEFSILYPFSLVPFSSLTLFVFHTFLPFYLSPSLPQMLKKFVVLAENTNRLSLCS